MRFFEPMLLMFLACTGGPSSAVGPPPDPPGNPVAGREAFLASCSGCHSSRDGFDLAYFGYDDSTIIRRARKHVSLQAARDIVAHIRSLNVAPVDDERELIFQPGGRAFGNDVEFALALFGEDRWPVDIDADRLRAMDTRSVVVPLELPAWSNEFDDFDWMPNEPLPTALLEARGGGARTALEAYYATPSLETLREAVLALRAAEQEDGPCVGKPKPEEPVACFEARRWVASLIAVHFLRHGAPQPIDRLYADAWWDVGDLSRKISSDLPNGVAISTSWLYLGWSLGRTDRILAYIINQLDNRDRRRLATFIMMRTMVDLTPEDRAAPYRKLRGAVEVSPPHWTADVLHSGIEILLEEIEKGNIPRDRALDEAFQAATDAFQVAGSKAPAATAELEPLRQRLILALRNAQFQRANREAQVESRRGERRRARTTP